MDGQIFLDDEFDCGLPGRPGTRFVVELKAPPPGFMPDELSHLLASDAGSRSQASTDYPRELPDQISVLFVDDDPI